MLSYDFCGLDFGTSNSTIGIFDGQQISMVPLENGKPTLRSAIFFDYETGKYTFGQQGINEYLVGGHGRLMMSLKSILGSSLMKEKTYIDNRWVSYSEILECLVRYIKQRAESQLGHSLTRVVMGRPVRFHDEDDKRDRLAQETLEKVAHNVGFKTVVFQYEPIAAALAYEQTISEEQIALIVDLGGGTADFSVIRLASKLNQSDRSQDVLANRGIHIGGTDFDTKFSLDVVMPQMGLGGRMRGISNILPIPSGFYHDLTTWHTINSLYTYQNKQAIHTIYNHALEPNLIKRLMNVVEKQQGHKILNTVEMAKCLLSQTEETILDLNFIEEKFLINSTRKMFETAITEKIEQLMNVLFSTVKDALLNQANIDSIFFTGGTTQIPIIRDKITQSFPNATIVRGDVFSSVGKGLILEAKNHFLQ